MEHSQWLPKKGERVTITKNGKCGDHNDNNIVEYFIGDVGTITCDAKEMELGTYITLDKGGTTYFLQTEFQKMDDEFETPNKEIPKALRILGALHVQCRR